MSIKRKAFLTDQITKQRRWIEGCESNERSYTGPNGLDIRHADNERLLALEAELKAMSPSEWTKICGFDELPEGNWLVEIQEKRYCSTIHTAHKKDNFTFVAGQFAYAMPEIIAYAPIPPR